MKTLYMWNGVDNIRTPGDIGSIVIIATDWPEALELLRENNVLETCSVYKEKPQGCCRCEPHPNMISIYVS